jgi:NADH-quinone oxidoreductase subunit N
MPLAEPFGFAGADFVACLSLVLVSLMGCVVIAVDAFRNDSPSIPWLTALTLGGALAWELFQLGDPTGTAFFGQVRTGGFAAFLNIIILVSGLFTVVLAGPYLRAIGHHFGEVYGLILFATAGMIALGTANSLVMLFVGLETMSVCLYILTGLVRGDVGSVESALKYFLLGAFSTGFFLYGIALLYGATGTMYLPELAAGLARTDAQAMFWSGAALLFIGFFFKVSAAPFHMWTPDVYQGAPTPLTGYMATASKASAFAALILVLASAMPSMQWRLGVAVVALVTMVLGNVLALAQGNVKRMLAYSSIAHAGYVLTGIAAGTPEGYAGALFYLLVYAIMNVGAFGVMAYLEWDGKEGREQTLDSLAGVALRRPLLGVVMAFFMLSLLGFPPLAGFFGKFFVFAPAVRAGLTWLVVVGVLASAVSAGYYLRVLYVMWMRPAEEGAAESKIRLPAGAAAVLVVCAVLLVALSLAPGLVSMATDFFTATPPLAAAP